MYLNFSSFVVITFIGFPFRLLRKKICLCRPKFGERCLPALLTGRQAACRSGEGTCKLKIQNYTLYLECGPSTEPVLSEVLGTGSVWLAFLKLFLIFFNIFNCYL